MKYLLFGTVSVDLFADLKNYRSNIAAHAGDVSFSDFERKFFRLRAKFFESFRNSILCVQKNILEKITENFKFFSNFARKILAILSKLISTCP